MLGSNVSSGLDNVVTSVTTLVPTGKAPPKRKEIAAVLEAQGGGDHT